MLIGPRTRHSATPVTSGRSFSSATILKNAVGRGASDRSTFFTFFAPEARFWSHFTVEHVERKNFPVHNLNSRPPGAILLSFRFSVSALRSFFNPQLSPLHHGLPADAVIAI